MATPPKLILETDKLAVPVPPLLPADIPVEVTMYMKQLQDFLQALQRDVQKLRG